MEKRIKEILEKLVSFNTTTSIDSKEAVEFVEQYLVAKGVRCLLVPDAARNRASLLATIGDPQQPGILFSGHLDVVTAEPSEWLTDPFKMTEKDGRFYGRGTVDMKGAIACVLALVDELKASGRTFHMVLTHDEEGGFTAIKNLQRTNYAGFFEKTPLGCIVMEPSMLQPICAHKGSYVGEIKITGKASHSAYPDVGVDALFYLVEVYNYILHTFYANAEDFPTDGDFSPDRTTLTITQMQGGDAPNKVPANASLIFSTRILPTSDMKKILSDIKNYVFEVNGKLKMLDATTCAEYKTVTDLPAFQADMNAQFIKDFYKKAGTDKIIKVGYGTEACYIQRSGIDTVIFGPGNIEQAHISDEYIEIEQLLRFCEFIRDKLMRLPTFINIDS